MDLELSDIQGIAITGYSYLPATRYLFYAVDSAAPVRKWLADLAPKITTETRRPRGSANPNTSLVSVAFTSDGLRILGVPADSLATFLPEFNDGMAHRASLLGDTGSNAPAFWDVGGPQKRIDLMVILYAKDSTEIEKLIDDLGTPQELREIYHQDAMFSEREPFGFRDGISQPGLEGSPVPLLPGQSEIKAGEFLLGYENEYKQTPIMPTIDAIIDQKNSLPRNLKQYDRRNLGQNGSYLVVRKLVQDVVGFWKFFEDEAKAENASDIDLAKTQLASKCVGRWPSGAPLVVAPNEDDIKLGGDDDRNNVFDFMTNDQWGFACPIGSHIRRANPRDSLLPTPDASMNTIRRHRIIRRGRAIGEQPQGAAEPRAAGIERGLMFVCLNADFEQQFEFIQRNWINGTAFGGLSGERDPLLGYSGTVTIPEHPIRRSLKKVPQFVTNRGGGYFFLPGIKALELLATLG
jgi:Dyp-type peroxidase family